MPESFRFIPSGDQARACDRAMRTGLADSLEYLCDSSRGSVAFDEPAIRQIAAGLREGQRYPASRFGIYYELVPALSAGDRDAAEALFSELAQEQPLISRRVVSLGGSELGTHSPRYVRLLDTDPSLSFQFLPPPPALAERFTDRLQSGMKLMQAVMPELAAEQDAIISEVVLAVGDDDGDYVFDGGSSYMLWGALFLNATTHTSDIEMVEVLAHEAGHSLLFGLCTEEGLVDNPDDERYSSPLRRDPRPMDGIYHATFVSARMYWTMSRLIESGVLSPQQQSEAEQRRQATRRSFEEGYKVVSEHGRLTATGQRIMQAARDYMNTVA